MGMYDGVQIATLADALAAVERPWAQWASVSAPVSGLRLDPALSAWLDADRDGRINASDVRRVVAWLASTLVAATGLAPSAAELPLSAIAPGAVHDQAATHANESGVVRLDSLSVDDGELYRLLLLRRDVVALVNNFVELADWYALERRALFEFGTLIVAGRELCSGVPVADPAVHADRARAGGLCVCYARVAGADERVLAFPVTDGDGRGLAAGLRALFVDHDGGCHEAEVVAVLDNPVSFSEALWRPFRRLLAMLADRLEAWRQDGEQRLSAGAPAAAATSAPAGGSSPAGLLIGGSVACAAMGSAFAFMTAVLADVGLFGLLTGVALLLLVVLLPALV
ncbi:MAG: hypothetical protein ACYTF0_07880, partial [Planctomycetota bacterium]